MGILFSGTYQHRFSRLRPKLSINTFEAVPQRVELNAPLIIRDFHFLNPVACVTEQLPLSIVRHG